ncbi:hypothetical protein [Citrobacter enshiensis]|uniref:HofO family protein n=1 Tax=Citrobacter enshiensis TaxID=2971264 RepID=UPI0023E7EB2C|nr:hypothetical protein [Citrobacter enshiensis]WET40963.1 hypothetical protein P2W74_01510 [Citrobacter enshiensis]
MNVLFDAWCALTPRTRILCWSAGNVCLGLLLFICLFYLGGPALREQREALVVQRATVQQQWRAQYRLMASAGEAHIAPDEKRLPFSPLDFQTSHRRLVHWLPAAEGGEMALTSVWEAIPDVFVRLAACGMNVRRFSLNVEMSELLLTLELERLNEG